MLLLVIYNPKQHLCGFYISMIKRLSLVYHLANNPCGCLSPGLLGCFHAWVFLFLISQATCLMIMATWLWLYSMRWTSSTWALWCGSHHGQVWLHRLYRLFENYSSSTQAVYLFFTHQHMNRLVKLLAR